MKKLLLFGLIFALDGCNVLGIGRRCQTCETLVYDPTNGKDLGKTSKEVCENQSGLDQYVKDNTGVKNGVGTRTTCR